MDVSAGCPQPKLDANNRRIEAEMESRKHESEINELRQEIEELKASRSSATSDDNTPPKVSLEETRAIAAEVLEEWKAKNQQ